jgi:hypothetical protein
VRPYLEKPFTKIGLAEWLKVKALSSNPTPPPKKKKKAWGTLLSCKISVWRVFACSSPVTIPRERLGM